MSFNERIALDGIPYLSITWFDFVLGNGKETDPKKVQIDRSIYASISMATTGVKHSLIQTERMGETEML